MLLAASATGHLGIFVIVIAVGFLVGVIGHLTQNRTLVMTGIIIIAAVSLYFVVAGEAQTR